MAESHGGGCCPPMDLMRSEPMQLVQVIVPMESAHLTVSYLGDLGLGMGDFLSEMAAMMNNSKPSENNTGDSFEQLQGLFNEMFQGDPGAFSSSSCSTSNFTSSCSFVFDTNDQRSSFETSSMGINNDPFGFDPRAHHAFSLGVDHQQDFKKGKNNGGRRNSYGVPTS